MKNYSKISDQLKTKAERQRQALDATLDHLAALEQLELNDQASRPQVKTDTKNKSQQPGGPTDLAGNRYT